MNTDPDTNRIVRSWLDEGVTQLPDRVLDTVLDQVPATPQRRPRWPARRFPTVNKIVGFGLVAAAVLGAVLIGSQLFGSPGNVGGPATESSPTPEASLADPTAEPTPSASTWTGTPAGAFVVTNTADSPVQVTVDVTSPGWLPLAGLDALTKNDDGLDPPQTVGGVFVAWAWPAGTEFNVFGDPCQWSTTMPATPATTPDEIAAALATQAETDATAPVDVTVGGYTGKAVTLHTPLSYDIPGASREEKFADCDESMFVFYGVAGDANAGRNAQGAGQVDELWILDVEGSIVILDAAYGPAVPADLIAEMRAFAASATFE
jgi:hypothetical protein